MVDNRNVVPYNAGLLLKYDCHINVEICTSVSSVKYIYKYIYKGQFIVCTTFKCCFNLCKRIVEIYLCHGANVKVEIYLCHGVNVKVEIYLCHGVNVKVEIYLCNKLSTKTKTARVSKSSPTYIKAIFCLSVCPLLICTLAIQSPN